MRRPRQAVRGPRSRWTPVYQHGWVVGWSAVIGALLTGFDGVERRAGHGGGRDLVDFERGGEVGVDEADVDADEVDVQLSAGCVELGAQRGCRAGDSRVVDDELDVAEFPRDGRDPVGVGDVAGRRRRPTMPRSSATSRTSSGCWKATRLRAAARR
jgi:hypothetical protein